MDDIVIANDIIEDRKKKHKASNPNQEEDIHIGHNVFIKQDRSKLKARELYKVIDTFIENGEHWATIQKHNTQFRMKKYKVKTAELMLLPGQQFNLTGTNDDNIKPGDIQQNELETKNDYSPQRKPKRKAAIEARKRIS